MPIRILLIEDERDLAAALAVALSKYGIVIDHTTHLADAAELARRIWATTIMSPNTAMEGKVVSVVSRAVGRGSDSQLQLSETHDLTTLKAQNSALWFVVATTSGAFASNGSIPPAYAALPSVIHLFGEADIRGPQPPARLRRSKTRRRRLAKSGFCLAAWRTRAGVPWLSWRRPIQSTCL